VRQQQREGQHSQDRAPDDGLPAEAIAQRPAQDRASGDRAEKHEEVDLRRANRDVKLADEIERVIAVQARQVEVLRKDQRG